MTETRRYRARWAMHYQVDPVEGGGLIVGPDEVVFTPDPSAPFIDLGDVMVMPAFVNAHTHLDLTDCPFIPPDSGGLPAWLKRVVAWRRLANVDVNASVRRGVAELIASGTAMVGDISATGASWPILDAFGFDGVVWREVLGLRPERYEPLWKEAAEWIKGGNRALKRGISPHAPYSTSREAYARAVAAGVPLTTHWMEAAAERELLERGTGPLRDFLAEIGALPDDLPPGGWSADPCNDYLGAGEWTLAHANFAKPEEVGRLEGCCVVYCPRTHAAFGLPPHPWKEFFKAGGHVALGTDSRASNPDLSVLNEAKFLFATDPGADPETLIRHLLWSRGMMALHTSFMDSRGGLNAAVVAIDPGERNPYAAVLAPESRVVATMINSRWVYSELPQIVADPPQDFPLS